MNHYRFFDDTLNYALDYEYWLRAGRETDFHYLQAIVSEQVEGHATHQSPVCGGVVLPGSAGILAKLHVQDPVLLIFDPPMAADGGCKPVAFQEEATVGRLRTRSEGGP